MFEDPRIALTVAFLFVCGMTALLTLVMLPFHRVRQRVQMGRSAHADPSRSHMDFICRNDQV
jgi:Flp pilus assembly protein protease CpaA